MTAKPRFVLIGNRPVQVQQPETKLEKAQRVYGRAFGRENWTTGSGPRFWTQDRIGRLAASNEEIRLRRLNASRK